MYTNQFFSRFKGNRDYVNGADMVLGVYKFLESLNTNKNALKSIKFRKFSDKVVYIVDLEDVTRGNLVGEFSYSCNGNVSKKYLVHESEYIKNRSEYDESAFGYNFEDKTILSEQQVYTTIEDIVGLVKINHYKQFSGFDGKWIFAQLDLKSKLPSTFSRIELPIKVVVKNSFTTSDIIIDNESVGTIKFSRI